MTATTPMTTTTVAEHFGVRPWQVRRLYESGRLPEPPTRMGAYRMIRPNDLPAIAAALVEAGYLTHAPVPA